VKIRYVAFHITVDGKTMYLLLTVGCMKLLCLTDNGQTALFS